MNGLSSSPTKESISMNLVNLSSEIIKDALSHIRGKLGEINNQIIEIVAR